MTTCVIQPCASVRLFVYFLDKWHIIEYPFDPRMRWVLVQRVENYQKDLKHQPYFLTSSFLYISFLRSNIPQYNPNLAGFDISYQFPNGFSFPINPLFAI